jgi:hypothetical protein
MAPAIRLTPGNLGSAVIMGNGPFGDRVATLLAGQWQTLSGPRPITEIEAVFQVPASLVVLALWRPARRLCDMADQLSFEHDRPWLPVIMDFPYIRTGPVVQPPTGPCYHCATTGTSAQPYCCWMSTRTMMLLARRATCRTTRG